MSLPSTTCRIPSCTAPLQSACLPLCWGWERTQPLFSSDIYPLPLYPSLSQAKQTTFTTTLLFDGMYLTTTILLSDVYRQSNVQWSFNIFSSKNRFWSPSLTNNNNNNNNSYNIETGYIICNTCHKKADTDPYGPKNNLRNLGISPTPWLRRDTATPE